MTVSSEANKSGPYRGNGVTTVFDYEFKIVDAAHLRVVRTDDDGLETTLVLNSDYFVSGVGQDEGGYISIPSPPPSTASVSLLFDIPFVQETDLENQGAYYAEVVETALDLSVMRDQQMRERLDRAIVAPVAEEGYVLAARGENEGKYLGVGTDGVIRGVDGDPTQIVTNSILDSSVFTRNLIRSPSDREAARIFAKALNFQPFPLPYGCRVGCVGDSNGALMNWATAFLAWPDVSECSRSHESPLRYFEAMHGGVNFRQRWEPAESASGKYSVGDNGAWASETSADFVRRLPGQIDANKWRAVFNFGCINDLMAVDPTGAFTIDNDNIIAEICRQKGVYLFMVGPPPRSPAGLSWPVPIVGPDPGWPNGDPRRAGRAAIIANRNRLASESGGLVFFLDVDPLVADANGHWIRSPNLMSGDNVHYWQHSARVVGEEMFIRWGGLFETGAGYPRDDDPALDNLMDGSLAGTAGSKNPPYTLGNVATGWTLNNAGFGAIVATGSKTTLDGATAQRIDFTMAGAAVTEQFLLSRVADIVAPVVPAGTGVELRMKVAFSGVGFQQISPVLAARDGAINRFRSLGWKAPYLTFGKMPDMTALVPVLLFRSEEVTLGEHISRLGVSLQVDLTNQGTPAVPHFVAMTKPKVHFLHRRVIGGVR